MKEIHFEWNKKKNEANLKKHGISFEEAKSVFYDQNAIEFLMRSILTMNKDFYF